MRAVDTSAWIEWLILSATGEKVRWKLPPPSEWLVPTIVQVELAKWLARNVDWKTSEAVLAYSQSCVVAELDSAIAFSAAELWRRHGLATADAIVLATARFHEADLLTSDAHFAGLDHVVYVEKVSR